MDRKVADLPAFSLIKGITDWKPGGIEIPEDVAPHSYLFNLKTNYGQSGFVETESFSVPREDGVSGWDRLSASVGAFVPEEVPDGVYQPGNIMWDITAITPWNENGYDPRREDWVQGVSVTARIAIGVQATEGEGVIDSVKRRLGDGALFSVANYAIYIEEDEKISFFASRKRTTHRPHATGGVVPSLVVRGSTYEKRLGEWKRGVARVAGVLAFIDSMIS